MELGCKGFGRSAKRIKDSSYHKDKMMLCKQEEAGMQLSVEQQDWILDLDKEPTYQELEAHYWYMAKIQEVISAADEATRPIFDKESLEQKKSVEQIYFANDLKMSDTPAKAINLTTIFKIVPVNQDLKNVLELQVSLVVAHTAKNVANFKQTLKEEMVEDLRYFNSLEKEVESLQSQLELQRTYVPDRWEFRGGSPQSTLYQRIRTIFVSPTPRPMGLEYGRYGVSKVLDTAYRGFLRVGTMFDIFQNILFPYSLNTAYCLLLDTAYWILFPSWSLERSDAVGVFMCEGGERGRSGWGSAVMAAGVREGGCYDGGRSLVVSGGFVVCRGVGGLEVLGVVDWDYRFPVAMGCWGGEVTGKERFGLVRLGWVSVKGCGCVTGGEWTGRQSWVCRVKFRGMGDKSVGVVRCFEGASISGADISPGGVWLNDCEGMGSLR
ncbi:hypothetical protein Tco_0599856 [Tanacetum coccineum]